MGKKSEYKERNINPLKARAVCVPKLRGNAEHMRRVRIADELELEDQFALAEKVDMLKEAVPHMGEISALELLEKVGIWLAKTENKRYVEMLERRQKAKNGNF